MAIKDILNLMKEEGFIDHNGNIDLYSEKRDEYFEDRFEDLCKEHGLDCDIDCDHVFDSPGLDIYCYAICVKSKNGNFENRLLTFYRC